jgi:8-oxo-dGTP diphosphatase
MSTLQARPDPVLRPVQRSAAYAVVTDDSGGVLLVRASARSDLRGRWFLPGGGLRHGEHPRDAVLRELAEETGLRATRATPVSATADVIDLPHRGVSVHTLRLIYEIRGADLRPGPGPRPEVDGTSDAARFAAPDELDRLALMPFVAEVLGRPRPEPPRPVPPERPEPLGAVAPAPPRASDPVPAAPDTLGEPPVKVQRPAAYAVLVDEAGARMLLTRLSGRTSARGRTWTLPGGGIDHGEHPLVALEREVHEETGLPYRPGELIDIGSRHFVGRAPGGRLEDFQSLRLVYGGSVPFDVTPRVVEVDGSTDKAAWIPLADLDRLNTVPAVRESLAIWTERRQQAGR